MKIKKEQIILAVIIVAAVFYILFQNQDREIYQMPDLPKVEQADVSKIEITKPNLTIVLQKKDDKWTIDPEGYLVNSYNIESVLEVIEQPNLTAMVSESKNFILYGLEPDEKITVKAWTGNKQVREFDIGKVSASFGQTFIKLADDHRVYHARKNLRNDFDKTVDEFRDKVILSFEADTIRNMKITKGTQSIQLTKQEITEENNTDSDKENDGATGEAVWVSSEDKNVDIANIESLLSSLSDIRCQEYIYNKKKNEMADPTYTIQLDGEKEYSLQIFNSTKDESENYYAISSGNDSVFLLIGWQADRIIKESDAILNTGM